jgi:uncharacterized protein with GYD domain
MPGSDNERSTPMPTYVSLTRWTEKGIADVKKSPERLEKAKQAFKAAGGELKQFYLVMGEYDMIVVSEAKDEESAARVALALGAGGSIRTETFRAFTEDEYRKIIGGLP